MAGTVAKLQFFDTSDINAYIQCTRRYIVITLISWHNVSIRADKLEKSIVSMKTRMAAVSLICMCYWLGIYSVYNCVSQDVLHKISLSYL
jgi:hypothetical protein